MAAKSFRSRRLISQPKADFAALRNWPSACCDQLPMALTSSFQLWFTHRLNRWTADFPSFEKTYGMHKMDSGKCFKSVKQLMSSCILHVAFILAFLISFWQRTTELQSLNSLCKWASIFFAMDSIDLSLSLDCFGDQNTIKNTKTYTIWLELIARVLNMPIGLKGNNYYSKVFKRVNYKLWNSTFWVVIIHVIHIPKLFITFRSLSSWPKIVHNIHNSELLMASRGLSLWDP